MSLADELAKLQDLRQSGALSEAEFNQAKAEILGRSDSTSQPKDGSNSTSTGQLVMIGEKDWTETTISIYVDGHQIGTIKKGSSFSIDLPAGRHHLRATCFLLKSYEGSVSVVPNQQNVYRVGWKRGFLRNHVFVEPV